MKVTKPHNLKSMTEAVITGMRSNSQNSCSVFGQGGSDKSVFTWVLGSQVSVCPQSQPPALPRLGWDLYSWIRVRPPEGPALPFDSHLSCAQTPTVSTPGTDAEEHVSY